MDLHFSREAEEELCHTLICCKCDKYNLEHLTSASAAIFFQMSLLKETAPNLLALALMITVLE